MKCACGFESQKSEMLMYNGIHEYAKALEDMAKRGVWIGIGVGQNACPKCGTMYLRVPCNSYSLEPQDEHKETKHIFSFENDILRPIADSLMDIILFPITIYRLIKQTIKNARR